MKRSFHPRRVGFALVLLGALAVVLPVAGAGEKASVTIDATGVHFAPDVYYSKAVLTVSGGEKVFQLEFDAHQTPVLGFFDAEGQLLPDGTYTWELKLMPDAVAARSLREAAKANDGLVSRAWAPQSGAFTIRNGAIARPDLVEPGQAEIAKGAPQGSSAMHVSAKAYEDSDSAVASGLAKERRGAALNGAPAATRSVSRSVAADSDRAVAAAGGSLDRQVAPKATTTTLTTAKPTPAADGSDGRSNTTPDR